jgi:hypothetical protein
MDFKTKEFVSEKIKEILELRQSNIHNKRKIIKKLTAYVFSLLEDNFTDFGENVAIKGKDNLSIHLCTKKKAEDYFYRNGKTRFTPNIYPQNLDKMTIREIKSAAKKAAAACKSEY